jgi:hypothetical protein
MRATPRSYNQQATYYKLRDLECMRLTGFKQPSLRSTSRLANMLLARLLLYGC